MCINQENKKAQWITPWRANAKRRPRVPVVQWSVTKSKGLRTQVLVSKKTLVGRVLNHESGSALRMNPFYWCIFCNLVERGKLLFKGTSGIEKNLISSCSFSRIYFVYKQVCARLNFLNVFCHNFKASMIQENKLVFYKVFFHIIKFKGFSLDIQTRMKC